MNKFIKKTLFISLGVVLLTLPVLAANTPLVTAIPLLTGKTTPGSTDLFYLDDVAGGNVEKKLTFGNLEAALTLNNQTGTLSVSKGGLGAATFGQGWLTSIGGANTIQSSTSPTVNYITATSTTATSIFAGKMLIGTSTRGIGSLTASTSLLLMGSGFSDLPTNGPDAITILNTANSFNLLDGLHIGQYTDGGFFLTNGNFNTKPAAIQFYGSARGDLSLYGNTSTIFSPTRVSAFGGVPAYASTSLYSQYYSQNGISGYYNATGEFVHQYIATDRAATDAFTSVNVTTNYGTGGVASVGTGQGLGSIFTIDGSGSATNEYVPIISVVRPDIGTGYTQSTGPVGRIWGNDNTIWGPIGIQPNTLNGIVQMINNNYNGSPADSPSAAQWIVTKKGSGGASDALHIAASTYPVDVGLGIVGTSNNGSAGIGFTKAIQIGGFGSPWKETISKVGTGIDMQDYATYGLYIHDRTSGATGPAIVVSPNAGNVGIGTTSPYAKLSVVGETVSSNFTATSTTATSTFYGSIFTNGLIVASTTASRGAIIGDSTQAAYSLFNGIETYLLTTADTAIGTTITNDAVAGQTIAQQQAVWSADANRRTYDWIVIEVGLNDMNPSGDTAPQAIARLQTLVNTVNADKKPGAVIVLATISPMKQRCIDLGWGTSCYTKWLDYNYAIMGGIGVNPDTGTSGILAITGVQYRVNSHTIALNDGQGNLVAAYDGLGDHIHENNDARAILAYAWRQALNKAGFLSSFQAPYFSGLFNKSYTSTYLVSGGLAIGTTTTSFGLNVANSAIGITDTTATTNQKHWSISSIGGRLYIGPTTDLFATSTPSSITINNNGNTGISTSSPGTLLSVGATNGINFTTGTSTFSSTGGINIVGGGCLAVNGACITGTGGTGTITTLTAGSNITFSSGATCTISCTISSTGGGSGTFPFTSFLGYNATSTSIGFLNGLFSTASSTFNATTSFSAAIRIPEYTVSTSTNPAVIDCGNGQKQILGLGTSAITINFSNCDSSSADVRLRVTNPRTGTAGTITWDSRTVWYGGIQPGQTTTANSGDDWFFTFTNSSSTALTGTASLKVQGDQAAGIQ